MKKTEIKRIVEATLLAAGRPVPIKELRRVFDADDRPERELLAEVLAELSADYEGRGIEVKEVASGYRIQVRDEMSEYIARMAEQRPPRYSRALMETLALIAYRQPITRGDIEEVRGVSVSTNIVRTLLERGWIRVVGHRDVPGRPEMFGTTKEFLDYFNLKTLDELPTLSELREIDSVNAELDFEGDTTPEPPAPDEDASDDDRALETATEADESDAEPAGEVVEFKPAAG